MSLNISDYVYHPSISNTSFLLPHSAFHNVFEIGSTTAFLKLPQVQPAIYQSITAQVALSFILAIPVFLCAVYIATWTSFTAQRARKSTPITPPNIPYAIPWVGNALGLAIGNPSKYINGLTLVLHSSVYSIRLTVCTEGS